jgi:predicted nucleic acid-binding protein
MIVVDASTLVSAALKPDSVPEQAVLRAQDVDVFALSTAVDAEISEVLSRPKFARAHSRRAAATLSAAPAERSGMVRAIHTHHRLS